MTTIDEKLKLLTTEEATSLLSGADFWHTSAITRLGIEALRLSDGPNGCRGTQFFNGIPAGCTPCASAMAATFNETLLKTVGICLADECIAKGVHILLGPTINIARSPLGGRGFESYSEDPYLSGKMAAAFVQGLQSKNIGATIKHFVCNDQEFQRHSISAMVDPRTLREIYLKPFQIALAESDPWALMTSYNKVNDLHVSHNSFLLREVLRDEWGWNGLVMSDWFGTYSTVEAVKAGLDLEMPGPAVMRGAVLQRTHWGGIIHDDDIQNCSRRVLQLVERTKSSGVPSNAVEKGVSLFSLTNLSYIYSVIDIGNDTPESRRVLRQTASESIVLLKNEANILPLDASLPTIAIIGPNGAATPISGGGSAALRPYYRISALDGIKAQVSKDTKVVYTEGFKSHVLLPSAVLESMVHGTVKVDFFDKPPSSEGTYEGNHLCTIQADTTTMFFADGIPESVVPKYPVYARVTATITPHDTGVYELGLASCGQANLYIDGKLLVENSTNQIRSTIFFNTATEERIGEIKLAKGTEYELTVRYTNEELIPPNEHGSGRAVNWGGIRIGAARKFDAEEAIREAADLAASASAAIVFVGLTPELESEGFDRPDMSLPGNTDALVAAVLKANPNTIIVSHAGTPVDVSPWIDECKTFVHAWYLGTEGGNALADVLFGKTTPSGKLSLSWPRKLSDNPSYLHFPGENENGRVHYSEGLFVGYKHYEKRSIAPLFPFGYGLSYTNFEYSSLLFSSSKLSSQGGRKSLDVSVVIKNTGAKEGAESCQLYIAPRKSSLQRPIKELKGFAKTSILPPGESATVKMTVDFGSLSYWDDRRKCWVAEKGEYDVCIGASVEDIRLKGTIENEDEFTWRGLQP
ncbi:glycoside hydrolase family 3 protein [Atractiella rhizophila]|nr:glycoside hydrolase family 3 protein [Atractiella rhizophila]